MGGTSGSAVGRTKLVPIKTVTWVPVVSQFQAKPHYCSAKLVSPGETVLCTTAQPFVQIKKDTRSSPLTSVAQQKLLSLSNEQQRREVSDKRQTFSQVNVNGSPGLNYWTYIMAGFPHNQHIYWCSCGPYSSTFLSLAGRHLILSDFLTFSKPEGHLFR